MSVELLYVSDPAFSRHSTGDLHPERPARLRAVERGVEVSGAHVRRMEGTDVADEDLGRIHSGEYVRALERFCAAGGGHLDPDTVAGPDSYRAARLAAGSGPAAVQAMRRDGAGPAFLALRPPGHHALPARAMGFCLFNNVAVTAAALVAAGETVAIVDWDVHHGNGTQDSFAEWPEVLYLSVHQHPFYPGTGGPADTGRGRGEGTTVNVAVPEGTAGDVYRMIWERLTVPILEQFRPDWTLISSGYDAHADDPLAELRLESADYGWMASTIAETVSPKRILVFLEGGYHLPAISESVAATVRGLMGKPPEPAGGFRSPAAAFIAVDYAVEQAGRRWAVA
jgi:acetoin utilization deacetylase AcuC-like enzyme